MILPGLTTRATVIGVVLGIMIGLGIVFGVGAVDRQYAECIQARMEEEPVLYSPFAVYRVRIQCFVDGE